MGKNSFFIVLAIILYFAQCPAVRADDIILKNGTKLVGTLRLDGIMARESDQQPEAINVTEIHEILVHKDRLLLILKNGEWVSCRLISEEIQIDTDTIWHLVRADEIDKIYLSKEQPFRKVALLPATTLFAQTTEPSQTAPLIGEEPSLRPPLPEQVQPEQGEYLSLEPSESELPAPIQMASKPPEKKRGKYLVSPEGGYSFPLGEDRDFISDGPAFGISASYEFFQKSPIFMATEFSFLRTMHEGRGPLDGVTQNANHIMIGLRGGYASRKLDFFLTFQSGVIILDASNGSGGKNETVWGLRWGGGLDYHLTPSISLGPELRFTYALESGASANWLNLLAKISYRF